MKTEHKLAWALRAAADDENVRFYHMACNEADISKVLEYPDQDWQLVKKPVVTHAYFFKDKVDGSFRYYECNPSNNWNLHITLVDGVPQKEVEFR